MLIFKKSYLRLYRTNFLDWGRMGFVSSWSFNFCKVRKVQRWAGSEILQLSNLFWDNFCISSLHFHPPDELGDCKDHSFLSSNRSYTWKFNFSNERWLHTDFVDFHYSNRSKDRLIFHPKHLQAHFLRFSVSSKSFSPYILHRWR